MMVVLRLHNICKYTKRFCYHIARPVEKNIKLSSGEKISYVQAGRGELGVLLMPGALGTAWSDFKPQIESLPALLPTHNFIAWNPSRKTFPIDFYKRDAELAKNLMYELGFEKFSALGWSDGGITALILAGNVLQVIDKLIIWGASCYINEAETKALENIRDVSKWSQRMREPMEKIYGLEFPQLWSDWIDGAIRIFKENDGDYCRKDVQNITAPTLIIHGKKDSMIAPEHVPYLRNAIKGSEYFEFAEGKHNIHLRYDKEFNSIVAKFLQKAIP